MDQNNNVQNSSSVTFADIVRMFRGKAVKIIIITLVVAILGGVAGVFIATFNKTYGSTINFYLTTKDGTNALIPLLASDSFAEKLILEENGLPKSELCDKEAYADAAKAVEEYNTAVGVKQQAVTEALKAASAFTVAETKYNVALAEYTRRFEELSIYLGVQDEIAKGENYAEKVATYEERLEEARIALDKAKEDYEAKAEAKAQTADDVITAKEAVKTARDAAHEASEKVLAPWREREDVKELIATITASVTYEYDKIVDNVNAETVIENAENQNACFLVVTVNVPNDIETAKYIVERLKLRLPAFVEDNIERLTDVNKPQCSLISTFGNVSEADHPELAKTVIKCSAGPALIVLVVACAIVITKGCLPADIFEKSPKKEKKPKKEEE